jgi:hypothetical protein
MECVKLLGCCAVSMGEQFLTFREISSLIVSVKKSTLLGLRDAESFDTIVHQHSVTFQKNSIFSNTAVITSDFARMKLIISPLTTILQATTYSAIRI